MSYFSSLSPLQLLNNLPGAVAQGIIWGIMALGVYITFRLLDVADLSVDGTFTTGGAVTIMLRLAGLFIYLFYSTYELGVFTKKIKILNKSQTHTQTNSLLF